MKLKINLSQKIIISTMIVCIATILSLGFSSKIVMHKILELKINQVLQEANHSTYSLIKSNIKSTIKNHLLTIANKNKDIVEYYYKLYSGGQITKEEALDEIRKILHDPNLGRVGQNGYTAILNSDAIVLVHPILEGKNLSGNEVMQQAIQLKSGYMEYKWQNTEETIKRKKVAGLAYFEPWDMIIWATSYIEDFSGMVDLSEIKQEISSIKIYDVGYQYIINTKGDVIVHPFFDSVNIMDLSDEVSGNAYIKEICTKKNGKIVYFTRIDEKKLSGKHFIDKNKILSEKLAIYTYLEEMDWIVISEIHLKDLYLPLKHLRNIVFLISAIAFIIALIISVFLSKSITRPIKKLTVDAEMIGMGVLNVDINIKSSDEIGKLATSIEKMKNNLSSIISGIHSNTKLLTRSSNELSVISEDLNSSTENISEQANQVAGATEEMSQNVNTIAVTAEEMNMNISNVASSTEQMSQNMEIVSGAMKKITNSIFDITSNSEEAADIAKNAMKMAKIATAAMNVLNMSAAEINEVTSVIKRIAGKTNLLALNATIEAATAGEAGRGFGVVANEIKELANQSAQAAENIAGKIGDVHQNTNEAVNVICEVYEVIVAINDSEEEVNKLVTEESKAMENIAMNIGETNSGIQNIARSVQELTAGSSDLSKNAGEAALGTNNVANSILTVSQAVTNNNNNTQKAKDAAHNLAEIAVQLNEMVDKFKI